MLFLIFQLVLKDKPDQPPSAVALKPHEEKDLGKSFKELHENKNFQIIAFVMTSMMGSYFAFGNLISPLLSPYGLSVQQLALGGALSSFVGIFGMIGGGIFIDKTKIFRKTLIFLAIAAALNLFILSNYTLPAFY